MEALMREANTCSSPDSSSADIRHTWLMAPEEFEAAPSTEMMKSAGPLLRGGFTAPLHMARRCARHGEATKPWRRTAFNVEGARSTRVDETCWRRPGDATAWRSAASITNLLGSSPEMGQVLYTPLTPIEEESSCLGCLHPCHGSGRDDRTGGLAVHDEEHAKGKPPRPGTSMLSDWTGPAWAGQPCASDAGSWEAAADVAEAKLRALGDACCSLSFCYVDVSRALPASFSSSFSFSSFWEHECVP